MFDLDDFFEINHPIDFQKFRNCLRLLPNFQLFRNALGKFIPNRPLKHVITITNEKRAHQTITGKNKLI